jgi:hypothetical protein
VIEADVVSCFTLFNPVQRWYYRQINKLFGWEANRSCLKYLAHASLQLYLLKECLNPCFH